MFSKGFLHRVLFVLCVLGLDFFQELRAEVKYNKISQLVIVYAPKRDFNTAFSKFDEQLTGLMAAAEKRNLRVVLINTDNFEGKNSAELVKNSITGAVKQKPSFVILATHGSSGKDKDGNVDTVLSFNEGMSFSELSESFEGEKNLKGISVQACHSGNEILPKLGKNTLACGASQNEEVSRMGILYAFNDTITSAINMGRVQNLVPFLKGGVISQVENLGHLYRENLLGKELDYSKLPIYGPSDYHVEFSGEKFEIVDPFGNPQTPCYAEKGEENSYDFTPEKYKGRKHIASLPSKVLPDAAVASLTVKLKQMDRMNFYFESKSHNISDSKLRLECNQEGEVVMRAPSKKTCLASASVDIGQNCVNSFKEMQKFARTFGYNKQEENMPSLPIDSFAKQFCTDMDKDFKVLKQAGVKIEAQSICLPATCSFFHGVSGISYEYKVGQCTKAGNVCYPTPKGAIIKRSDACMDKVKGTFSNECKSAKESEKPIDKDKCYKVEDTTNLYASTYPYSFAGSTYSDVLLELHSQVPSFKCVDGFLKLDESCCKKNDGVFVKGVPAKESDTNKYKPDYLRYLNDLQVLVDSESRCQLKQAKFSPEGWGEGWQNSGHNGGFNIPTGGYGGGYPPENYYEEK